MSRGLIIGLASVAIATSASAADMPTMATSWDWSGLYAGLHSGAAASGTARFSDPFGSALYGDRVRTPGWLFGGQIGYNWQLAQSPWFFGLEASLTGLDSDGTDTCFAVSGDTINANCRVRPQILGTLSSRFGYAFGSDGRTLLYVKGGPAWFHGKVNIVTNNASFPPGDATAVITSRNSNYSAFGGMVGAGVEYAMTPAWSFFADYGYLTFARTNINNVGSYSVDAAGAIMAETAAGTSGLRQDLHLFKVGLNYKWGVDPAAAWPLHSSNRMFHKAAAAAIWVPGWESEIGARYVRSRSRFQYDLGWGKADPTPPTSLVSRLTYAAMNADSGEIFGRVDAPSNWFVKGFGGWGKIRDGGMTDEDFGISDNGLFIPYSNTSLPKLNGRTKYATADLGYSFWRGQTYKLGGFVGYNYIEQHLLTNGCFQIANQNGPCVPPVQVTSPGSMITHDSRWNSLRIGVNGEFMPFDRIKLGGEVAYLPYASYRGVDTHIFGGTGQIASINPQKGEGRGVQLEGLVSYLVTPTFSIGVGGRYWAMWTDTSAQSMRAIDCTAPGVCASTNTPPQHLKASLEQAAVFVQASIKFDAAQASANRY